MAAAPLKKSYKSVQSLEQFYSGGPFAVSSDGSFIVCACNDAIKIVDASNSSIKSTIEGDSEAVTALALTPDDKFLFSASHSRQIRVWDMSTLKCLRSWKGHEGPVMAMACHASGGLLATAGADMKVRVWDVDGGFCTHYFKGHKGVVTSIIFHPDSSKMILFSGSDDATARVWDLATKKCIATLEKHFSTVTSLAVSEDGWTLLTAGRDKVVNMWDLHDYSCKVTVPSNEEIEAVCVVSSTSHFRQCLDLYNKQHAKKVGAAAVCFVTVGKRGVVRVWSSEGAICLFEQKTSDVNVNSDDNEDPEIGFIAAVMLPSDEGLLCVTGDQQFFFYSLAGHAEAVLDLILSKRLIGYNEEIADMKFLGEDEQFLAVATTDKQVRVYDVSSMSCSYVLTGHSEIVLCLDTCVSSSGTVLIATGSKDKSVRLWDAESRNCLGVGIGHLGAVGAIAFSKKRRNFFVSGSSDRTLKVWSTDNDSKNSTNLKAKAVVAAHDKDINTLAIAPNDSFVCSGSQDHTAHVWKLPELVSVVVLKGHKRGIWSVEFSPVDQCVITASGDKTVKIWAIADGSCLKTFEGHTAGVLRASFITRGSQFVSCGADGLLKLWTVKTDECIATYDQHEDKVWALAIGKKTEMIATGGSDAVINLWHDSTASDKEEAFRQEEEGVLRGQDLENAVSDADYSKAIRIAFELRRPHKLFELFSKICREKNADFHIDKALADLDKDEYRVMFEYVREWNTKPKLCHIAQFVLFRVFNILPPTEILEIKGIGELLEGLIPYCQRHFSRIDRLDRSTFLLDYTLMGMSVIEPQTEEKEVAKDAHVAKSNEEPPQRAVNEEQKHGRDEVNEKPSEEQKQDHEELNEKPSSKKRKSKRSGEVAYKKVKAVRQTKVATVSSTA